MSNVIFCFSIEDFPRRKQPTSNSQQQQGNFYLSILHVDHRRGSDLSLG
jgi:hypothetical protein